MFLGYIRIAPSRRVVATAQKASSYMNRPNATDHPRPIACSQHHKLEMNMNKLVISVAVASAAILSACSSEEETQEAAVPVAEPIRSCDSIRDGIINLASTRGVTIVKIYEPKTLTDRPDMISCSGRAGGR